MDSKIVLFEKGESCTLYSIQFEGKDLTEFDEFIVEFENDLEQKEDFLQLFNAVSRILNNGALERYFRPEGKINDRVFALPIYSCALRLYCLRMSDSVLIVGNGGVKTTATYQEDDNLRGYVISLQKLDVQIRKFEKQGIVTIEKGELVGIDDKTFSDDTE